MVVVSAAGDPSKALLLKERVPQTKEVSGDLPITIRSLSGETNRNRENSKLEGFTWSTTTNTIR